MIYLFSSSLTKELNPDCVRPVICDVQGRCDPLCAHCEWQHEWQPLPVKGTIRAGFWGKLPLQRICIVPAVTAGSKADSQIRRWRCWAYCREGSQQTDQCHLHLGQQSSIWLCSFFFYFFLFFNFSLNTFHSFLTVSMLPKTDSWYSRANKAKQTNKQKTSKRCENRAKTISSSKRACERFHSDDWDGWDASYRLTEIQMLIKRQRGSLWGLFNGVFWRKGLPLPKRCI